MLLFGIIVSMNTFHLNIYLLSIFSLGSDKEAQIEEFSSKFFEIKQEDFQIKEHSSPSDLAEAGQGDPVFIVKDKKGNPIGVIKTISTKFPDGRAHFKAEYEALDFLSHLQLKNFHTVKFKGIAETTLDGEKKGIIAEEFAKGLSINQFLKNISKTKNNQKRELLLRELNRGLEKTAIALAELHQVKKFSYPSQSYLIKFDTDHPPGPSGIIHGDTHPGNIFYDPKTDQISFIDFGSTHLAREGAPILQDAGNFLLTFEVFASYYHLTPNEIDKLTHTFLETYKSKIPEATNESINFYKNYYIKTYASTETWDEEASDQAEFIHSYCREIV
ncbi:MAG: hypothetical protein FJZ59_07675 [Chlamydiae bacterium]|nr:hypothetical protein [Chlamydiota bacterium]